MKGMMDYIKTLNRQAFPPPRSDSRSSTLTGLKVIRVQPQTMPGVNKFLQNCDLFIALK